MVINAWENIQPNFNLLYSSQIAPPSKAPWDKTYQITFDVPTSESRIVMTLVRVYKEHAYLCLIDGKIAGFSRRAAEVNRMIESWKPAGYIEPQVSILKLRQWTHTDKQAFNKFIIDAMKKLHIPGAAVAIVHRNGTILYQEGFGIKRLGSDDAVTTQTPFMIGSTTKPLTTLLMAMLVDKQKLSWQTPISNLLKNFRLADDDLTKKLQLYQTVSASTGMPRRDLDWVFKYTGVKPEDRIAQMQEMCPTTGSGETFQYSNYLFMAGGYAAAHAYLSQENLENAYTLAMQELIFDPLGMKNTVLKIEDALKLGAAFPHTISYDGQLCESSFTIEKCCYSIALLERYGQQ